MSSAPTQFPTFFDLKGKQPGILYVPAFTSNPYQKLFYSAVNKQFGLQIIGIEHEDFSREALEHYAASAKILHLHWMHVFIDPDNPLVFDAFLRNLVRAKELGYTIIYTVHNLVSHESKSPSYERNCYQKIAELCDGLLVHSKNTVRIVHETFRVPTSKIYIVEHGSYQNWHPITDTRRSARKELGIQNDELVFLFFGMLRRYKGIGSLLNAYQKVSRETHANTRLIIAGDLQDHSVGKAIQRATSKDPSISTITNRVPDAEVARLFLACDAVVLPFTNMLTSGSAILALSFKKPVIAPNIGNLPELINSDIGLLYTKSQKLEGSMKEIVRRWEHNHDLGFSDAAFRAKLRDLTWDRIVKNEFGVVLKLTPANDWQKTAARLMKESNRDVRRAYWARRIKFAVRHPLTSARLVFAKLAGRIFGRSRS